MSTLHAIKLGGENAHKDRSVSTGVFSLNGNDISYIMSGKTAVLKVPTLGCKSTNMQSTDFHSPADFHFLFRRNLTSCTLTKYNLYLANSLAALVSEPDLCGL